MTFKFFSLDYIYYPVSGIMWVWHRIFGALLGNNNAWAWVLSVVFLVFTLRAILFKPFMKQMSSQMKMQAVQPEMKKLRAKYKDDKQRLAEETMKLNKEAGVNPLASCLPALIQAPVFIGLFHVLRSFKPGWGQVYFFGKSDVQSFVEAKLFKGAPLSSFMTMPTHSTFTPAGLVNQIGLVELGGVRSTVIAVGIPLTILAGIATHLTSRRSVGRQAQMNVDNSANPQAAIMNKMMMYVFPLFVVVGGPFFPMAILFYWLSNNTWTFGQLWVAHRIQDKKLAAESQVVEEAKEAATFTKPKPGARPVNPKRTVVEPTSLTKKPVQSSNGNGKVDGKKTGPVSGSAGSGKKAAGVNGTVAAADGVASSVGSEPAESAAPIDMSKSNPQSNPGGSKKKPGSR